MSPGCYILSRIHAYDDQCGRFLIHFVLLAGHPSAAHSASSLKTISA